MGAAGTVLLKNVDGTLPLRKPRSLVLVGSDSGPAKKGPNGYPDRCGLDGPYLDKPISSGGLTDALIGILAQGWGSGYVQYHDSLAKL